MSTIGSQFARLGETAACEGHSQFDYLEALLVAEMEERESRAIAAVLSHEAQGRTGRGEAGTEADAVGSGFHQVARAGWLRRRGSAGRRNGGLAEAD